MRSTFDRPPHRFDPVRAADDAGRGGHGPGSSAELDHFAAAAAERLGSDNVQGPAPDLLTDTMHRDPVDRVIVLPRTTDEVRAVLELARAHGQSVHPYSTGRNWGYGTSFPVQDGTRVMVDLTRMKRIWSFDPDLGTVTVEPGVTQGDLAAFLAERGAPFVTPTTGAGPTCSVVGNALERGYGLTPIGDHFQSVTAIEAVLADGSIYRSPFMPEDSDETPAYYKWGTGPYLDGAFTQAGNGIVTRMTMQLWPRPERTEVFFFFLRDDALMEQAVDAIRTMMLQSGMPVTGINFLNKRRVEALVPDDGSMRGVKWFGTGVLFGDAALVKASRKQVRKAMKGLVRRVFFMNDDRVRFARRSLRALGRVGAGARLEPLVENTAALLEILAGTPTEFEIPLAYEKQPQNMPETDFHPSRDGCGLLWYVPMVPIRGSDTRRYVEFAERVTARHGFDAPITFSTLSRIAFNSTIPIMFEPTPDETDRAMACLRDLIAEGQREGFHPYRYHSGLMDLAAAWQPEFWAAAARVKNALDPDDLISPGRYVPQSKG